MGRKNRVKRKIIALCQIEVEKVVVSGDAQAMAEMVALSGQSKAPTLDWEGEVLADFGVKELVSFFVGKV